MTGSVMDLVMEIFEAKIEFNWDIELAAAGRVANWQEQALTELKDSLSLTKLNAKDFDFSCCRHQLLVLWRRG